MGAQLHSLPPLTRLAICSAAAFLLLFFRRLGDAPAPGARSIRQIQLTSEQVHDSYFTNRQSMRGSGAAVVEFRWYFLDDAATGVPVGSAFRTRLAALDAQGRPAKCDGLRVNVSQEPRA
ncbi:unnamed protein product [Symbiodinium sp. CCMP2592]|nr:unnamed protein product [Symbiodinium sp. CCMP2592]